jgi:hypothetical protein
MSVKIICGECGVVIKTIDDQNRTETIRGGYCDDCRFPNKTKSPQPKKKKYHNG